MTEFSPILEKNSSKKVKTNSTTFSQQLERSYVYIVKIDHLNTGTQNYSSKKLTEYCFYLNLLLEESFQVQTPCIDIGSTNDFFQLKVSKKILKIQVVHYELMRKVAKIGLKGTDKEFRINYKDLKYGLEIEIEKRNYTKDCKVECWSPCQKQLESEDLTNNKFYFHLKEKIILNP